MSQKKIGLLFLVFLCTIAFVACEKEMSTDDPLPEERERTVFITTNSNRLYGYNAETGQKTWEEQLSGDFTGSPVIMGDTLYLVTTTGRFYSWNLRNQLPGVTGTVDNSNGLSMASSDTTIYYMGGNRLFCLNSSADVVWSYNGNNGASLTGVTLANNRLYAGFGNSVHCIDLDGNNVWVASAGFGPVTTTVKANGPALFFGDDDNNMYAVDSSNGSVLWNYTTLAQVKSSPLVYGGMSISGSDDNNIYCVDMIPGTGGQGLLRWSLPTQERVRSSPAIHVPTNTVLVGCHDYNLYAIDHVSGRVKWKYPAGGLILSSPTVVGDHAFFSCYDNFMYCINVRTGSLVWKTNMNYTSQSSPIVDNVTDEFYSGVSGMSEF
jgi:outer membrane protein assembly factor BamB